MARPSLKAQYFVAPDGIVTIKAPALKPKERRFIYDRDGGECQRCARPVMFGGITASPSGPRVSIGSVGIGSSHCKPGVEPTSTTPVSGSPSIRVSMMLIPRELAVTAKSGREQSAPTPFATQSPRT